MTRPAAPVPGLGDGVRFVHDGGHLPPGAVVKLPAYELAAVRIVDLTGMDALCTAGLAARVLAALVAADLGEVVEPHDGRPRRAG